MVCISLERLLMICHPTKKRHNPFHLIFFSVSCGLFWSVMPLVGWSRYSLETGTIHCSVEWAEKSFNVISYNITIFIFVFIGPFYIISVSSYKLITFVNTNSKNSLVHRRSTYPKFERRKSLRDKKLVMNLVIFGAGFFLTWLPYGCVSMYSAFISVDHIKPIFKMIPVIFAKSSLFIAPSYYLLTNRNLLKSLCIEKKQQAVYKVKIVVKKENEGVKNRGKNELLNTKRLSNECFNQKKSIISLL